MARIQATEPGKQGLLSGFLTRLIYAKSRRRFGRVVMPVRVIALHSKLLWGYGQMERSFALSNLVPTVLKDLAQLRVAMLIGCPF